MYNLPAITLLTGTLNPNLSIFQRMLESVRMQLYPKNRIEHIVLDGGSRAQVIHLAKRFGCTVIVLKHLQVEETGRLVIGLKMAKGTLTLLLASDNILPTNDWLRRMVEPFSERRVFCSYPAYNTSFSDMDILTRYFALIGAPDPTLYYLKKSDKIPTYQTRYDKGFVMKETERYYVVQFTKETLPTVGDNGYLIRTEVLRKVNNNIKSYIHLDAFATLLSYGFDTYGVVKNSIIHVSRPSLFDQVRRRVQVKEAYTDDKRGTRLYMVFDWKSKRDRCNLFKYIFFSLTFIEPLMLSIRGYLKIRDRAWFLHPVMCFLMVVGYGWSEIRFQLKRLFNFTSS